MDISIIIVNWNTREHLENCLNSITSITKKNDKENVEIIVVDNASSDGSREMVKRLFPNVKLINSRENIGFARANNIGLNYSNGKYILFLNPDTIMLNDTIKSMVQFMEKNPKVGAIGCKMKSPVGVNNPDAEAHYLPLQWQSPSLLIELFNILFLTNKTIQIFKKYLPYQDPRKSGYVVSLYGGCLMVRREVLESVGSFDNRFFLYGEDFDLCRRIINAGWKIYYMSEAEIIHFEGKASEKKGREISLVIKCDSIYKYMEKYYGKKGRILYRWTILVGALFRFIIILNIIGISIIIRPNRVLNYKGKIKKNLTLIKWGIGLLKLDYQNITKQ